MWMRCPIDVVFVDDNLFILHQIHSMKPFRISRFVWEGSQVIEFPPRTLAQSGTQPGHQLAIQQISTVMPY